MQSKHFSCSRASINALSNECRKALKEYYELVRLPQLTELQAVRLQHFLELAEQDDGLSFLMNEIDEMTYQDLGFYDEAHAVHFKNEAARAQEFILTEAERQALTPSAVARTASIGAGKLSGHHPRVEMVFDSTHTQHWIGHHSLLLDGELLYFRDANLPPGQQHLLESRRGWASFQRTLLDFLKEESISIFIVLSLAVLLALIFLM